MIKSVSLLLLSLCLQGCVGSWAFEDSARSVDFNGPEGKTGWSKYEQNAYFPNRTKAEVFEAAKAALNDYSFSVFRSDLNEGIVLGEHGMTAYDWNIMAAIYLRQEAGGVRVRVQAEGSKDIGIFGDATAGNWTGSLINLMRNRLDR